MERDETENTALSQVKDMLSGIAAGLVSKVVEYPFDTIKVFYQSGDLHNTPKSALSFFGQIIREEGFTRLFHGLPAPLAGACVENMIVFHFYGVGERYLRQRKLELLSQKQKLSEKSQSSANKAVSLNMFEIGLAGMFSGIGTGLWLTPVELIKCKMQTAEQGVYKSTMDCLLQTIRNSPLELTTGLFGTMLREVPGAMAYFISYNSSLRGLQYSRQKYLGLSPEQIKENEPPIWAILMSGAAAGIGFWSLIYPFDTAKTYQQVSAGQPGSSQTSMLGVLQQRYRRYGVMAGWYRGLLSVTIPRALLSNSIIFLTFEKSRSLLDSLYPSKQGGDED